MARHRATATERRSPRISTSPPTSGPYLFPDIRRRRVAGTILGVAGAGALAGGIAAGNGGLVGAGALLAAPRRVPLRGRVALGGRPDRSARGREPHRRLPRRPRVGAARLARPALATVLAHPALQRRRAAVPARPRRARRRRRRRSSASTSRRTRRTGLTGVRRFRGSLATRRRQERERAPAWLQP